VLERTLSSSGQGDGGDVCIETGRWRAAKDIRVHDSRLKAFTQRAAHLAARPRHHPEQFLEDTAMAATNLQPLVSAQEVEKERREPTEEETELLGNFFQDPVAKTLHVITAVGWFSLAGTVVGFCKVIKKRNKGGYTVQNEIEAPKPVAIASISSGA